MLRAHAEPMSRALEPKPTLRTGSVAAERAVAPSVRKPLVLVGIAGAGKSTVARQLGACTGRSVFDLDDLVVKETGLPIAEFVRRQGRVALLAKQRALVRDLLTVPKPCIIAAGAETFCDAMMRSWLLAKSCTVHLDVTVESVLARLELRQVRGRSAADLGPSLKETVVRQLRASLPWYREAAHTVSNDGAKLEDVVDEIVRVARLERVEHGRHVAVRRHP